MTNAIVVWITDSRVERRLAAIRAEGDPLSLADYRTKDVPPEKDAATYLRRAKSDLEAVYKELRPVLVSKAEREKELDREFERAALTEDELNDIKAAFDAYPKVLPLLEQAADCPFFSVSLKAGQPTLTEFLARAEFHRLIARLLGQCWVPYLMSRQEVEEAARRSMTLVKLSRHFEKEPPLIAFLIACACHRIAFESANDVLQAGDLADDTHQQLEAVLAGHDIRPAYLRALKLERAFSLDRLQELYGRFWLSRAFLNRETLRCLDVYDSMISRAADGAMPEPDATSLSRASRAARSSGPLAQLLIPALQAVERGAARVDVLHRAIRVINALERRDEPGEPPAADLTQLGLPKSATTDPFSGDPLIVKPVDGGWLVYSVWENRVDDGGDLESALDAGLRPFVRVKVVDEGQSEGEDGR